MTIEIAGFSDISDVVDDFFLSDKLVFWYLVNYSVVMLQQATGLNDSKGTVEA